MPLVKLAPLVSTTTRLRITTCQGSRHREQNLHFDNAHLGHDIVNILRRYESRLKGGCNGVTGSSIR